MELKLALRNIRRSVRDYAIYFLTLLFGVAVFYAFNSIGSQQILFDLESAATARQFEVTSELLGMFSGVIACVLGFLILYANRFLIKRRKREFGTYLVLGMSPVRVSAIVLFETVFVGFASLAVGLVVGIVLSQGLSFVTAALFGTTMTNYQFVFSFEALLATLASFAAIYVVVALFNTLTVSRYQLIDLLRADERNERAVVRNPWVCLAAFVVSLGILAFAYLRLADNGMVMLDSPEFLEATVGMLVGSLVFFWSLAGFVIAVVTRLRGFYLRGLRMFTVRQIASKVNTAFLSLWAVCVLLFFSITTFSTGMGLVQVFMGQVTEANPFSATLSAAVWYGPDGSTSSSSGDPLTRRAEMAEGAPERLAQAEAYGWDMAAPLEEAAPQLWAQTIGSFAQIDSYGVAGELYGDLMDAADNGQAAFAKQAAEMQSLRSQHLMVVPVSQYNAVRALIEEEPVELAAGECLLVNNMDVASAVADAIVAARPTIEVGGQSLTYRGELYATQLEDNALRASGLVTVVPDAAVETLVAEGAIPEWSYLDVMYADNGLTAAENDQALGRIVGALQPLEMGGFEKGASGAADEWASLLWPVTRIITADSMMAQMSGMRMMITYLALYIGFIFLVSTAAILAIQQLSEASDSSPRYRALWRLGCDARMLRRSLLAQVTIYFLVPLGLAVCHSACAITVLSDSLFEAMGTSVAGPIGLAAVLTVVVYGGYLLVTYFASRGIVAQATQQAARG